MKAQLLHILRTKYRGLLLAFVIGAVIGVPLAHLMPQIYTASMTISPARYASDLKPSNPVGALSLLGDSDNGDLSDFALYLELLTSPQITGALFNHRPDIVHRLYRDQWHGDHWEKSHSLRASLSRLIYGLLGSSAWAPPDPLSLSERLEAEVKVQKSTRTPVAVISYTTPDRQLGIDLLTALHQETESLMKDNARVVSEAKVLFLSKLIASTPSVSVNSAIMQSEIRNQITAAISQSPVPFAAQFIAKPGAPVLPNRTILIILPAVCGVLALLAYVCALLFLAWREKGFPLQ